MNLKQILLLNKVLWKQYLIKHNRWLLALLLVAIFLRIMGVAEKEEDFNGLSVGVYAADEKGVQHGDSELTAGPCRRIVLPVELGRPSERRLVDRCSVLHGSHGNPGDWCQIQHHHKAEEYVDQYGRDSDWLFILFHLSLPPYIS